MFLLDKAKLDKYGRNKQGIMILKIYFFV